MTNSKETGAGRASEKCPKCRCGKLGFEFVCAECGHDERKHEYTERTVGRVVLVACSCGAQHQFVRENALARAAKVRAWKRAHESSSDSSPEE